MLKQTIVWTALPHRRQGNTLRLSAVAAPRLDSTDGPGPLKLGVFPDFLNWPGTLTGATFEVEFSSGLKLPATVTLAQPLRPDLWMQLFTPTTDVIPFVFEDYTGVPVVSFPAASIHDKIQKIYQDFGTKPGGELPTRTTIGTHTDLVAIARPRDETKPYVAPTKPEPVFVGKPGPELPDPEPTTPAPKPKGGCAGCAGCGGCLAAPFVWLRNLLRRLLKRLGLIAALPFTMGGIGGGGGGSIGSGADSTDEGPMNPTRAEFEAVQYFVTPQSITPQPMPTPDALKAKYDFHRMVSSLGDYPHLMRLFGLIVDLEVTLGGTVPPATGTVKVIPRINTATTTEHRSMRTHYTLGADRFLTRERPGSDVRDGLLRLHEPNRFRLLQLDVAGSAIKVQSMATKLVNEVAQGSAPRNEPEEQGLPALQTAGLSIVRPDLSLELQDAFLRSYSLNKGLALTAIPLLPIAPAAVPVQPPGTDELFADDVLRGYRVDVFDDQSARWHTLCHRVGTYTFASGDVVAEDEGFVQPAVTESLDPAKPRELRIPESLFTWNGWSLAAPRYGNTIDVDVDAQHRSKIATPSNAPVTTFNLQTKFTPKKKSLPRLRFGYSYQLRVRTVDLAGNSVVNPLDAAEQPAFQTTPLEVTPLTKYRRFEPVAPPMVVLQKKPVEGESLERLVVRSVFDNSPAPVDVKTTERHLVPPKTSQPMAEQHRKFDGIDAIDADYSLVALEKGHIAADIIAAPFDLPYLPEPFARGVLLVGLPGAVSGETRIEFEGAWPKLQPFLLHVEGIAKNVNPDPPKWEPLARLLTVQVPQGMTYPVRISSWFHAADLDTMATWDWTALTGVADLATLRASAEAGRSWMQMPWRTLVLVHAVQQPLEIPEMQAADASARALGDTVAPVSMTIAIDAKSTQKLDLRADWIDTIDDPGPNPDAPLPPKSVPNEMQLAEQQVVDPTQDTFKPVVAHAFGDTKHHFVTYTPTASTRFREYFPATDEIVANLNRPTATEAPLPISIHVPSSARPAAPKVLYLMPLFQWQHGGTATKPTATRSGAGFRVYLDRPWYSSGDGELLGVVLRPPSVGVHSAEADALKKYTSEWGMDPLWPSSPMVPLAKGNFKGFAPELPPAVKIRLAEVAQDVDVVGYEPQFDAARNLWYCDILLDPATAYFPMVRLALVRFQPHSIAGVHISPVVLADFVQLVPHRHVTYDVTQAAAGVVDVEVSGPTYVAGRFNTSIMLLRLETESELGATGELSWTPIARAPMRPVDAKPDRTVWQGTIRADVTPVPSPLRVVVMELELHRVDERGSVDPLELLAENNRSSEQGFRVTFTDTLEL